MINFIVKRIKPLLTVTIIGSFIAGVVFWGGFNWALESTNDENFCISCHEMKDNVFEEYKETIHYTNRTGVRATCPDCHVPKDWVPKIIRKIQASREVYHMLLGTIDTREKFEAERLHIATREWKRMKANDSLECRNCHNYESMDFVEQGQRAVKQHSVNIEQGKTCIDCHMGIAHQLPEGWEAGAKEAGLDRH